METTTKTQPQTKFKVKNIFMDLPPEEKEALHRRKAHEVRMILSRHYEAGTLFKK